MRNNFRKKGGHSHYYIADLERDLFDITIGFVISFNFYSHKIAAVTPTQV